MDRQEASLKAQKLWAVTVIIVCTLSITAVVVAWVVNTKTQTNRDIRITEIKK